MFCCDAGGGDGDTMANALVEWRQLSHIPFGPRHRHAVAVCNGLIYVIGGLRTALGAAKNWLVYFCVWFSFVRLFCSSLYSSSLSFLSGILGVCVFVVSVCKIFGKKNKLKCSGQIYN